MIPIILSTILVVITLIFSIVFVVQKRKKAGITGIKSALSAICFLLVTVINLLAYWFDYRELLTWSFTAFLFILGAYFTKYIPVTQSKDGN
ncbi:hypothetical protein WAK64_16280 [Bacillus spongiae]|uniref:Group-specific protein n=1 Tax=Bacillus spongiae TaxID=2683610 RepID=A0ABU8HHG5_9BACI